MASSTKVQANVLQEVSESITSISHRASENVAGAEQISVAAEMIASSALDMDEKIVKYKT